MSYFGKIIGIIIGIMSGTHIYGIIVGFIIGHIYDKMVSYEYLENINTKQCYPVFFCISTFQILGHLIKSKGRVTELDIQFVNNVVQQMGLIGNDKYLVQNAFMEGKKQDFILRNVLKKIYDIYHNHYDLIKLFLEIQIQAAFNDGFLDPHEKKILFIIIEELKIPFCRFKEILFSIEMEKNNYFFDQKQYSFFKKQKQENLQQMTLFDAYKILGIEFNDKLINVKRAYRKLMSKYHPDKIISKQLSIDIMEKNKEKIQLIQIAYNLIKKHYQNK